MIPHWLLCSSLILGKPIMRTVSSDLRAAAWVRTKLLRPRGPEVGAVERAVVPGALEGRVDGSPQVHGPVIHGAELVRDLHVVLLELHALRWAQVRTSLPFLTTSFWTAAMSGIAIDATRRPSRRSITMSRRTS